MRALGVVIMVIGFGWAIIGLGNIIHGFQNMGFGTAQFDTTMGTISLAINGGLFILPGVISGILGLNMARKDEEG